MPKGNKKAGEVAELEARMEQARIEASQGGENPEDDEEEDDEDMEGMEMSPAVLRRIIALKGLDDENSKITEEYKRERCAMEAKYNALRAPLHDKRKGIVSGEIAVERTKDEAETEKGDTDTVAPASSSEAETAVATTDGAEEEEEKGIPAFWLQVLGNHNVTGELITEEDVEALQALEDIRCSYSEDMSSFTLTFYFAENKFFTNRTLTKTYKVEPDLLDDQAPTLSEVTAGGEIDWKPEPGCKLTVREIQKKQRSKAGKKKGQVRYVTTTEPKPSFFHFFSEPTEDEDDEEEEEDEEKDKEQVTLNIEDDYEVAHVIRTSLIPHAIGWFTGELIEDDDDDYDEDEDEDDDEDSEEDEDEEEEEEEEEEEAPKKRGGKKGGKKGRLAGTAAPGAGGDAQPECKQS